MCSANTSPLDPIFRSYERQLNIRRKVILLLLILAPYLAGASGFAIVSATPDSGKFLSNTSASANSNKKENLTSTFGLHDILTFDITEQAGKLHLLVGGKKSVDSKRLTLRYLQYNHDDKQWHLVATLNEKLPETIASRGNDVQIAAHDDRLVALWQTKGELPGVGSMISAYSTDAGKTWQRGGNPGKHAEDINEAYIDLAADTKGHFHVAWLSDPLENGYQSLYYSHSRDYGKSWIEPVLLDNSTCACCWNRLIRTPDDQLFVLYRDSQPRDMALIQSHDYGNSWQHRGHVGKFQWEFSGCPHIGGGLSHNGQKNSPGLHAIVWTGQESSSGLHYLGSTDNGHSWTKIKTFGETTLNGDIAGRENNVAAVWNQMEAEGLSVYVAKSGDGGLTWSQPELIAEATRATVHPKIIATQTGFIVLWTENPTGKTSQIGWHIIE